MVRPLSFRNGPRRTGYNPSHGFPSREPALHPDGGPRADSVGGPHCFRHRSPEPGNRDAAARLGIPPGCRRHRQHLPALGLGRGPERPGWAHHHRLDPPRHGHVAERLPVGAAARPHGHRHRMRRPGRERVGPFAGRGRECPALPLRGDPWRRSRGGATTRRGEVRHRDAEDGDFRGERQHPPAVTASGHRDTRHRAAEHLARLHAAGQ